MSRFSLWLLVILSVISWSSKTLAITPDDPCDITGGKIQYPDPADQLPENTTFWGYYKCSSCNLETSAKPVDGVQACDNCGSPHTDEIYYATRKGNGLVASDQIANKENIDEAESGLKLECPYCRSTQFANSENCQQCGSPLDGVDLRYDNNGLRQFESDQVRANPRIAKKTKVVMWAAGAVITVATTLGIAWGLKKTEVTARIDSAGYKHTIALERFEETSRSDWQNSVRERRPVMPTDGRGEVSGQYNIRNARQEIHHYEKVLDHYRTEHYTEQVPYTDYENQTVDNGNGSFTTKSVPVTKYRSEPRTREVPAYRDEPVYRIKVDYDTYLWFEKFRRHTKGFLPHPDDQALPWPVVEPGPLDRLRHFSDYKVVLSYVYKGETKEYEVTPSTESEFREWQPGDERILVRNNFGMILEVKEVHAEAPE